MPTSAVVILLLTHGSLSALLADAEVAGAIQRVLGFRAASTGSDIKL
jgi:hypothetical protein